MPYCRCLTVILLRGVTRIAQMSYWNSHTVYRPPSGNPLINHLYQFRSMCRTQMPRIMIHQFGVFSRGERITKTDELLQVAYCSVQPTPTSPHSFQVENTHVKSIFLFQLYHHMLATQTIVLQTVAMQQPHCVGNAVQDCLPSWCAEGRIFKNRIELAVACSAAVAKMARSLSPSRRSA